MKDLQIIQDEYSSAAGMSLWICSKTHECITKKSLIPGFLDEEGDKIIKKVFSELEKYEEIVVKEMTFGNRTIFMGSQPFYINNRVEGYCMAAADKDNILYIDKAQFTDKIKCFVRITEVLFENDSENQKLKNKISKIKADEKFIAEENERLQHENDYDELTRVHSRAYFFKKLEEIDKDESMLPVSLVVGDVNNLKFTNDMFGHRHGDWLLCKIAQILQEEAYDDGYIVARCGGDEFFIIMPNTKRAGANYYCKRVNERLAEENDTCLPPSVSLGSAKKSEMTQSLNRLLEVADAKMYAAKSEFKHNQNLFEEMLDVIVSRGFVTRENIAKKTELVKAFGKYIGFTDETIKLCIYCIRYQDIGLSIVPKRVYNKKGNYTDREWREIKKHPQLAMKIVLIRPETAPISEWVHTSHENYDGSGWTQGLAGDQIHKEAAFVRLITEYVDKEESTNVVHACNYIEENIGKIFEPALAGKFLEFLETMNS